jgi:hypothetical protein
MLEETDYRQIRARLLSDYHSQLVKMEQKYTTLLTRIVLSAAREIQEECESSICPRRVASTL